MATPWNDDPNGYEPQILANVTGVLHEIDAQAGQRADPTLAMAQGWHRRLYDRVPLPVSYYAGEIRDRGNGRTARMWANWAALRYGLPAFVSVKPRPPGNPYAAAGMSSMAGDHDPLVAVFYQMLAARLTGGSP